MADDIKLTKLTKCAGCGAKVGAGMLSKLLSDVAVSFDPNLIVGFDKSDDACVYRVTDGLAIVQTVDFFPPIVDDPFTFGRIAATNALSDVYAMGGEPKVALNILMIPESMDKETVHRILAGGYQAAAEAGAVIAGGHSIFDETPKYGLSVTGFVDPERMWTNSGAQEGDVLLFTKPLGVGVLSTGVKADMVSEDGKKRIVELMTTLNKSARDAAICYDVHACTDVTGFGLLGHLCEMMQGADKTAVLDTEKIDILPEARSLAEIGILPESMYRNRAFAGEYVDVGSTPLAVADVLFDPETSGGLLFAVSPSDADALYEKLMRCVPSAQRIGVVAAAGKKRIILR